MKYNSRTKSCAGKLSRNATHLLTIAFLLLASACIALAEDNSTLNFEGGIAVIPVTGVAANGAVNLNVVRGVNPGAPWRIASLEAEVSPNGQIRVKGRGLLLASGNGIGTNAGQSVHASLFCGPANGFTEHDSTLTGVALAADGDFRIDDLLSPALPASCDTPVLLIRNAGGVWFAAGIPKLEDDHRRN
jgi:hypothetical protein